MTNNALTDKALLLLGTLRSQGAHGYELQATLNLPGTPIRIGKANAYQLLRKLEEQGWVRHKEERQGGHPPRRVYRLTAAGEKEFQRLIHERLAAHVAAEHPDAVSLNYLHLVPRKEALKLLRARREALYARLQVLRKLPSESLRSKPGGAYVLEHARFELRWLDTFIRNLDRPSKAQRP
jgi:DNA-binding PadR family transcriptional regulator